jgi:addiction module HigA family antidote
MAGELRSPWSPSWAVIPGEVLAEALEERGMTQAELARRTGRPLKTISEIVTGKAAITPDTAIQLERTLGIVAGFWNGLEAQYRQTLAADRSRRDLEDQVAWLDAFPVRDLVRYDRLPKRGSKAETVADLFSFFGVASPSGWEQVWSQSGASYRLSQAHPSSPEALSTWLRWGEIEAAKKTAPPFDKKLFRSKLTEVRALSRMSIPDVALGRLEALCLSAGVIVLRIPEVEGARVSGAARWLRGRQPLIQISLRYRSDDQLWYTFFHEAGHLIVGPQRRDVVEDDVEVGGADAGDHTERAVDAFARDLMIPPDAYGKFVEAADFRDAAVRAFADSLVIAPGIVAGRLQHDHHVGPGALNQLKVFYAKPAR